MSYVKNGSPGKITMDLPRSNYIYELPLLSFADIHGGMNLSLLFNHELYCNQTLSSDEENYVENKFLIEPGYKLSVSKYLKITDGYPEYLIDAAGKRVEITGTNYPYGFDDDSRGVLHRTTITSKPYAIVYPDYSMEYFNAKGMLVSVVDKYSTEVVRLNYNANTGVLTNIIYRNSKNIQLSYTSGKLLAVTYSNAGCTTRLARFADYMEVRHYSGETIKLQQSTSSDGPEFFASLTSVNNKTEICRNENVFTISDYINNVIVNTTTYAIGYNSVEVTNNEGVKTRMQYQNSQLICSYEVDEEEDVNLDNGMYGGSVQINKTMENNEDGVSGTVINYRRGLDGHTEENNVHTFSVTQYASSNTPGRFILTGWMKKIEEVGSDGTSAGDATITIEIDNNRNEVSFCPNIPSNGKWKFFTYAFYANVTDLPIKLPTSSSISVKDLRLSHESINENSDLNYFKFQSPEYILIYTGTSDLKIPISEAHFIYQYTVNGVTNRQPITPTNEVCFEDLLRYKINKKKNLFLNEVYADRSKTVISSDTQGVLLLTYKNPSTNEIETYSIDQFDLGMRQYTKAGHCITRVRSTGTTPFLRFETTCGDVTSMKALNNNLDVISETNEGITTTITRNNDLVTAVETKDSTNTAINTFTKTTVYGTDESGNPTITETDEFGQQIMYTMDSIWGSVESVSLYKDDEWQTLIIDEYDDDMCALTKRTFGSTSGRYNALTYSNGNLSTMETDSLGYDFEYTNGKLSAVSKNDVTIEEHAHTGNTTTESFYPSNGSALHTTVANFDIYGRMTSIEDVLEVEYKNLIRINNETPEYGGSLRDCFAKTYVDRLCGETTNFVHDITGKVIRTDVTNTSSNILIRQESFAHDGLSRLNKSKLKYDFTSDKSVATTIDYVKEECDPFPDQRVSKYIYGVNCSDNGDVENIVLSAENCDVLAETTNTYDNFKRITAKEQVIGDKLFNKQFTFNKTRVTSTRETVGNVTTNSTVYQYNGDLGRVSAVVTGGYTTSYHYDQFGQLVRENNQALDTTFVYVYDNDTGNLTSVKKYAYTASSSSPSGTPATTSFGYSADKLDTFDDATIAYNTMGCPTTYEGKTAIWARGKLSRLSVGTMATGISNYAYTYNAFGQRIGKTYTYTPGKSASAQLGDLLSYSKSYYYDHAGRLISESVFKTYYGTDGSSENIVFLYDESGIIGMARTVGSTTNAYYFQRNLLGDVVAIYDTNGNMVAKYLYDAWGNCTVSSETTNTVVANANPIRYRGYYYDDDTGLYYLNARYYSPKWRRFISPDDTAYLDPDSVNGLNLYCYCGNDPVNYVDPSGCFPVLACILGLTALIGIGLTIGGVASDSNLMTAIGLTMVAIPALISGGIAALATTGALATGIGIGTMIAGAGTGLFAWAEYQEAFSGNNWMLDAGMSEEWYTGLMFTTAGLATLGTFASGFAYSFNIHSINKVGTLEGTNYKGIRFTQKVKRLSGKKAKLYRTLEWHTHSHMGYKPHWQMNAFSNNGGIWIRGKALSRWSWWLTKI